MSGMPVPRRLALAVALLAAASSTARSDGGTVRARSTDGPFVVTVLTTPTPLAVGRADISVLLQDPESLRPVLDADVEILLAPAAGDGPTVRAAATRESATNRLLYAATLDLPAPGRYTIRAEARRGPARADASGEVAVQDAAPAAIAYWPWLALPFIALALYAAHQRLASAVTRRRVTISAGRGVESSGETDCA